MTSPAPLDAKGLADLKHAMAYSQLSSVGLLITALEEAIGLLRRVVDTQHHPDVCMCVDMAQEFLARFPEAK